MKKFILSILVATPILASAQSDWKWPEDEALFKQAQEKQAYYKVLMGQDKPAEALSVLKWLYVNNPELNPSIYIDGTKCAEDAMEKTSDANRKSELQDSALWMYDMRIKYWGNEASVMDRKAYTAFKYYYKTSSKYPLLIQMYQKTLDLNGAGISTFNLVPIMTVAKYAYEWKLPEMTADKVLDIHSSLSAIMDEKEKTGEAMTDTRNRVDALLSSIPGLLSCDYIEQNLAPRLKTNPQDLGLAKKIFAYSVQAKCVDTPYFMEAAEVMANEAPDLKLLIVLAGLRLGNDEAAKAMEYYEKALPMAQTQDDKYTVLIGQAKAAVKLGQKAKARSLALQAAEVKPSEKEPYNLIGYLYFGSFDDCKEGTSRVKDRLVFIAAYDMFKRAGNTAQMEAAKAQFPSIEEIFNEGLSEGQEMNVGCWIGTKVTLQRR